MKTQNCADSGQFKDSPGEFLSFAQRPSVDFFYDYDYDFKNERNCGKDNVCALFIMVKKLRDAGEDKVWNFKIIVEKSFLWNIYNVGVFVGYVEADG